MDTISRLTNVVSEAPFEKALFCAPLYQFKVTSTKDLSDVSVLLFLWGDMIPVVPLAHEHGSLLIARGHKSKSYGKGSKIAEARINGSSTNIGSNNYY